LNNNNISGTICIYIVRNMSNGENDMLKATGIVRKVDELGRIVIPIELRRTMNIEEKDALEIYVDGNSIILKKYEPACILCGNAEDVINYKEKNLCKSCLVELSKQVG
jgi:transcriptional pleiotropic regulator of transition state genes